MDYEALLQTYGVKPTAIRLLTIKNILKQSSAFSFEDLYQDLQTVDRSTVFRTVTLFEKHKLLHGFEDGMGKRKYCLCKETNEPQTCHTHQTCHHIHISCKVCGRTYCLPSEHIPHFHLPPNFHVENINCVVTGICGNCLQKKPTKT